MGELLTGVAADKPNHDRGGGEEKKKDGGGGWEVGERGIVAGKGRKMRKAEMDWGGEERKKMRKRGTGGRGDWGGEEKKKMRKWWGEWIGAGKIRK